LAEVFGKILAIPNIFLSKNQILVVKWEQMKKKGIEIKRRKIINRLQEDLKVLRKFEK